MLIYIRHPNLIRQYRCRMGYFANVAAPSTYNEKMFWRKIFDRNPMFGVFSDKLQTKAFLRSVCPDLPLPKTLWTGDDPLDIPVELLKANVLVKANHGSSFNYFVQEGKVDRDNLAKIAKRWLNKRYGRSNGEWAYSRVRPKLFVEEMLFLGGGGMPTDLKFHVCLGQIVHIWAADYATDRSITLDPKGNPLNAQAIEYSTSEKILPMAAGLLAAIRKGGEYASRIGRDIDYARIDFLITKDEIFGGEITVYPAAGYDQWTDPIIEKKLARAWDLRASDFLKRPKRGLLRKYCCALIDYLRQEKGGNGLA